MEGTKPWERPWSTKEMIENANKWTLAGDAGLLKYLEEFSENMLAKAEETNTNLNALMDNLNQVGISLDLVNNEFMGLHNTQFIESRVYEEDETIEGATADAQLLDGSSLSNEKRIDEGVGGENNNSDEERLADMKEAIMLGLKLVNEYYDRVQVAPDSDSEEEDAPYVVLQPKDVYSDRPLPFVIGTKEWQKKWHVGLLDTSSDEEERVPPEHEQFSEDDENLGKSGRIEDQIVASLSDSDTENYISDNKIAGRPIAASSTFDDSIAKSGDLFGSESDEESKLTSQQQVHIQNPPNKFAEELAAKLGDVVDVNKRPLQRPDYHGNLISDSPPPLDDEVNNKGGSRGLFSDNLGLFDDDSYSNAQSVFKTSPDDLTPGAEARPKKFAAAKSTLPKLPGGLFDDDGDDEYDDLFKVPSAVSAKQQSYLKPYEKSSNVVSLIDEQPPDLEPPPPPPKIKKPIGGVAVIPKDIFVKSAKKPTESLPKQQKPPPPSLSDSESEPTKKMGAVISAVSDKAKDIVSSLFGGENDDDDDLFSTGTNASNKFTSGLFDSEPPPLDADDLFDNKPAKTTTVNESLKKAPVSIFGDDGLFSNVSKTGISLFDDIPDDNDDDFDDLFAPKPTKKLDPQTPKSSDVADGAKRESKVAALFQDDFVEEPKLMQDNATSKRSILEQLEEKSNLFDDVFAEEIFDEDVVESGVVTDGYIVDNAVAKMNTNDSPIVSESTNVEVDDPEPSFASSASSSHHISTDIIFHNEQENDSIFVTKTSNDLPPSIPELRNDLFSNTSVVASRSNANDLFSDSETPSKLDANDSVFESVASKTTTTTTTTTTKEKKGLSFLDDFDDDDDLFKDNSKKNVSLFGSDDEDLFATKGKDLLTKKIAGVAGDNSKADVKIGAFDSNKRKDNNVLADNDNDKIKTVKAVDKQLDIKSSESKSTAKVEVSKKSELESHERKFSEEQLEDLTNTEQVLVDEQQMDANQNIANSVDDDSNVELRPKVISPGKLRHSLNINVSALLPGAAPPRRKPPPVEKSISVDSYQAAENNEPNEYRSISVQDSRKTLNINVGALLPPKILVDQKKDDEQVSKDIQQPPVNFEDPVDNVETLKSITKDRARIGVKRRPSSRQARQESLRKSGIDFQIDLPPAAEEQSETETTSQTENLWSPSTEEDDIFSLPKDPPPPLPVSLPPIVDPLSVIANEPIPVENNPSQEPLHLLSDSDDSPNDLFSWPPPPLPLPQAAPPPIVVNKVVEKNSAKTPTVSIFDDFDNDQDDDDDIFGSGRNSLSSTVSATKAKSIVKSKSKSLFGDDDDDDDADDDLFGVSSNVTRATASVAKPKQSTIKKLPLVSSQLRKLDDSDIIEDPLDALHK